jgi:hypothetical protein
MMEVFKDPKSKAVLLADETGLEKTVTIIAFWWIVSPGDVFYSMVTYFCLAIITMKDYGTRV